jgi:hypothetical protein
MSGKLKAERVSASASPTPYDQCSQQALLIAILKLVAAQPTLLIRQRVLKLFFINVIVVIG